MFKKILVATDGSEHAHKAVELASDLAEKFDASLILIHVLLHGRLSDDLKRMAEVEHLIKPRKAVDITAANSPLGLNWESVEAMDSVLEAIGKEILKSEEIFVHEKGIKDVKTVIGVGDAANEILGCAASEQVDLIVTGSRGLTNLKSLFTGSVSHKINHLAKCTYLSVH